jgi:tetratricopeptide (TPR) repeat protein
MEARIAAANAAVNDAVNALRIRGYAYVALRKWDNARHEFSQIVELEPDDISAGMDLANCTYELGELEEARQQYEVLIKFCSDRPKHRRLLAGLCTNRGGVLTTAAPRQLRAGLESHEAAITIYRDLAKRDPSVLPDMALALVNSAQTKCRLERAGEAAVDYGAAIRIYKTLSDESDEHIPGLAWALESKGTDLNTLPDLERAAETYTVLIEKGRTVYRRDLAGLHMNIGELYRFQEREFDTAIEKQNAAIELLQELLARNQNDADILSMLGATINNRGMAKGASERFDAAKADFKQAIDFQSRAITVAPTVATYHEYLGNHWRNMGEAFDAQKQAAEACQAYSNAAESYANSGDLDRAIEYQGKAVTMAPTERTELREKLDKYIAQRQRRAG